MPIIAREVAGISAGCLLLVIGRAALPPVPTHVAHHHRREARYGRAPVGRQPDWTLDQRCRGMLEKRVRGVWDALGADRPERGELYGHGRRSAADAYVQRRFSSEGREFGELAAHGRRHKAVPGRELTWGRGGGGRVDWRRAKPS